MKNPPNSPFSGRGSKTIDAASIYRSQVTARGGRTSTNVGSGHFLSSPISTKRAMTPNSSHLQGSKSANFLGTTCIPFHSQWSNDRRAGKTHGNFYMDSERDSENLLDTLPDKRLFWGTGVADETPRQSTLYRRNIAKATAGNSLAFASIPVRQRCCLTILPSFLV